MNYKQSSIQGEQWTRCYHIDISNQFGKTPVVGFQEEVLVQVNDQNLRQDIGRLEVPITDYAETFDLVDPETGVVVAQSSVGQLYAMIYSYYLHRADLRDNPPEPEPEEPEE